MSEADATPAGDVPDTGTTVRVRLFGVLADRAGTHDVTVAVAPPVTAAAVRDAVAATRPEIGPYVGRSSIAVNLEVARPEQPVAAGDEIALLPPVAGGAGRDARVVVGVQAPPLPVDDVLERIGAPDAGAAVTFLGTVRDHSSVFPEVARLVYTAYDDMAEHQLRTIADEVLTKWPAVTGVALIHAVGDLGVGAHTVLVAVTSPHRAEAYDANRYALEELKRRVPVWKQEVAPDGTTRWVGADHDH